MARLSPIACAAADHDHDHDHDQEAGGTWHVDEVFIRIPPVLVHAASSAYVCRNGQDHCSTGCGPIHSPFRSAARLAAGGTAFCSFAGWRAQEWPVYGGDAGGTRYSAAALITRDTVNRLALAWTFHTGDGWPSGRRGASFENTLILVGGRLLVCTPTDRVIALDPLTGRPIWTYDPERAAGLEPGNSFLCRGVAVWHDATAAPASVCAARVVLATLDARVIELRRAWCGAAAH